MKKLLVLLFVFINISISQTNFNEYFPLKSGNVFVYTYSGSMSYVTNYCNVTFRVKIVIIDTISYSGNLYYYYTKEIKLISHTGNMTCSYNPFMFPFNLGYNNALRVDSISGNIYWYSPGQGCSYSLNENMIDSLSSKLNDLVNIKCGTSPYSLICTDTNNCRQFYGYQSSDIKSRLYVRNAGLLSSSQQINQGVHISNSMSLRGSVINGIVWGDTSFAFTGIIIINEEIPKNYDLFQNYPNPFNPTTKIRFDIPVGNGRDRSVQLILYDILGREVTTLVNEQLKPGTYEVEWPAPTGDGSSYASGVYFYSLVVSDASAPLSTRFTKTNKMILLK